MEESTFNEFQFWRDPLPSVDLNEVVGDQTVVDCLTGVSPKGPVRMEDNEDEEDEDMMIHPLHEEEEDPNTTNGESTTLICMFKKL